MHPFDIIKNLDHHAYFIHSFKDAVHKLKEYLKNKFNINHVNNPDFIHEKYNILGIDESRKIKVIQSARSFNIENRRIYIIEADSITLEAQNSLLKMFEEPNFGNHFFLIMPSVEILLPTLKSRLNILNVAMQENDEYWIKEVKNFIKMNKKDRVDYVDGISKDISDEKMSKIDAIEFLKALESELYEEGINSDSKVSLKAILKARDYINDRSSSIKQLLEYVALSI